MSGDAVIVADRLTKSYGTDRGVEDLSFEVRAGEVFGYLGPNGAGKSTTIRTMLDLLRPSSGSITVFGLVPSDEGPSIHARTGYVPGEFGYVPDESGHVPHNECRISFGYATPDEIAEGVRRFRKAVGLDFTLGQGEPVWFRLPPEQLYVFDRRTGARIDRRREGRG